MGLKLLHLDIETTPHVSYTWGTRKVFIAPSQLIAPSTLLCWAAKWHGGKMHFSRAYPERRAEAGVRKIHALMDAADAVCHYNGNAFDIPRLNQEFLAHGLAPPSPSKNIDLYRAVRRKLNLPSNKMSYVAALYLRDEECKADAGGMATWIDCMAGDAQAWKRMEMYNRQDVAILEALYTKLLPWIDGHPNRSGEGYGRCVNCAEARLQARGTSRNTTMTYQRFQCLACGKWQRSRLRDPLVPAAASVGIA